MIQWRNDSVPGENRSKQPLFLLFEKVSSVLAPNTFPLMMRTFRGTD